MGVAFVPVKTDEDVQDLVKMADEIWTEYWPDLIGMDQTRYMVEKFQTARAIKHDMAQHDYRYWFLEDEAGQRVGYVGGATEIATGDAQRDAAIIHNPVVHERWSKRFFISKIYLYASQRGKHYASQAIRFFEALCREEGLPAMYLTVNKGNDLGIRAYLGNGFQIVDRQVADIGGGFVMDDAIMAKEIA